MEAVQDWREVGARVAEARVAVGLSQTALAARVELDRTALVRIEAGERRVSALELSRLAGALGVPFAHFLTRPPAAVVSRRSALDDAPSEASRAAYRLDSLLEEHARNAQWLVAEGFLVPPPPVAARPTGGESPDPVEMAAAARRAIGVPSGPLGPMADVLEHLGLFLTVVDESAEGASLLLGGAGAAFGVAVISGQSPPGRRRWTAAHELGHHLLQDEYHSDAGVAADRDERERLIDRFAQCFLLPAADLQDAWAEAGAAGPRAVLLQLAAGHRLSWSAVVNQAAALGLLDPAQAQREKSRTPTRGDFLSAHGRYPEPDLEVGTTGRLWRRAVLAAWEQGAVTAPRAVELLYGVLRQDELPTRNLEDPLP